MGICGIKSLLFSRKSGEKFKATERFLKLDMYVAANQTLFALQNTRLSEEQRAALIPLKAAMRRMEEPGVL